MKAKAARMSDTKITTSYEHIAYGTNGDEVFGFTPEDAFWQTNMKYFVCTIPIDWGHPIVRLAVISTQEAQQLLDKSKKVMDTESK